MKLVIQIPCYNEEEHLPQTLRDLPREVEGFDEVEIMVVDDGSTDRTAEVAREHGASVFSMNGNRGYGRAWISGLIEAVERGADVVINTDGDNQYRGADVPALVRPILEGRADIVVGERPVMEIEHWSALKKFLQRLGSRVVRRLSGTDVADAPSGYRAMTRDAAIRLNLFNHWSPSLETLVQAGRSNLRVVNVPIGVNGPTRPSRLMKSMTHYIRRNGMNMVSAYVIYAPQRLFGLLALLFFVPSLILAARYLILVYGFGSTGHVQSVVVGAALFLCGVFTAMIGVVAHLLAINRRLLEELRYLERSRRAENGTKASSARRIVETKPELVSSGAGGQ